MSTDPGGTERKNLYAFAIRCAKESGARNILDVACGDGEGAHLLAFALPAAEVVGFDIDSTLIQQATAKFQKPNLRYRHGDARRASFSGGEFDYIVSFHTVEHFSAADQKLFLQELKRILAAGGELCMATPDRDVWTIQGIAGAQPDHIRELSQKEFAVLVEENGFIVKGSYGQNVLKGGTFLVRRFLNVIKKMDILSLRRLLGRNAIDRIDEKTQPVHADTDVAPLQKGEKASVTVLVCRKIL